MAVPIIGINTLNVLMLVVDSALCGRLPNSEHVLSALGFATQLNFLLMVGMLGLLVGTVGLVARAHGANDASRVDHVVAQSTQLTAIFGVVVGALGSLLAVPMMKLLGASDDVAAIGGDYLRVLMLGTPFFYLTLLYTGILRGVGNTRLPFLVALVANVINAVLNYVFVLGNFGMPSLGVTGSAIGTVTAQLANLVILVLVLRRGTVPGLKPKLAVARVDRDLARELLRIGWPAALDMLVLNAGFLAVLGMLGTIDELAVAAHGLGLRVQSLAWVPGLSVAQATGAMVGMALGAGNAERAREVLRGAVLLCVVIMSVLGLAIFIAAHPLTAIFDVKRGTPLELYAVEWMRILGYGMVPSAIHIALMGLFQGAGATRTSLRINIYTTFAFQIPIAWLLGFPLGLEEWGIWLSLPIALTAKAVWLYAAYRQGAWAVTGIRVPVTKERTP